MTVIGVLFGLAFVVLGWRARQLGLRCGGWPHTRGQVIESRVDESNLETASPKVRYRYTVGRQEFIGWRVSYSGYGISRQKMQAHIAAYPPGQAVEVYYDPARPEHSVLDNRPSRDWLFWVMAGVALSVGAVWVA